MNKITDDERFNKLLYKKIVELFNGNNSYSDAIYNTIPHSKIIYNGKEIKIIIGITLLLTTAYYILNNHMILFIIRQMEY